MITKEQRNKILKKIEAAMVEMLDADDNVVEAPEQKAFLLLEKAFKLVETKVKVQQKKGEK